MRCRPDVHAVPGHAQRAHGEIRHLRIREHGPEPEARSVRQLRPGARRRCAAPDEPVDDVGRALPPYERVIHLEPGCMADAVIRLRDGPQDAVLQGVERADEEPRARLGKARKQVASRVTRSDRLRQRPEHGPGVQALLDPERRCTGHLVPRDDRVLHRGGAAPRRQHREVEVDPPVPRHVQDGGWQQGAVGDDGSSVELELREPGPEGLVAWRRGRQNLEPDLQGAFLDRARVQRAPPTGARVGSGEHGDHLVARSEERIQRRHRDGRGSGEEQSHGVDPRRRRQVVPG